MKPIAVASFIILTFILSACLPQDLQMPQSPVLSVLERKSGLLVYLGTDGNIYICDQGGSHQQALTMDGHFPENDSDDFLIYHNPTWSPDSKKLAFTSLDRKAEHAASNVFVADLEEDNLTSIYSSTTELPYYLYWSPDLNSVSFLSTSSSGEIQILQSVSSTAEPKILDTGTPYYWSWAPDGRTMIVHAADPSSTGATEKTAFLSLDQEVTEFGLDVQPGSYQTPAWSPDGTRILYAIRKGNNRNTIVMADADGSNPHNLAEFDGKAAFVWSYDGQKVAFIDSDQTMNTGIIGKLHVLDLETSEEIVQDKDIIAFFWSPNSKKLAYFVPFLEDSASSETTDSQNLLLELNMLDVESGENQELLTYKPTSQFTEILPFFDQYHQSNTIWSPDSNNLVLSYIDSDGKSGIAVVAASGRLEPRLLVEGLLAFWSWN